MAQQIINVGQFANDATGDPARTAFIKINQNFTDLFGGTVPISQLIVGPPPAGQTAVAVTGTGGAPAMTITAVAGTASLAATGGPILVTNNGLPNYVLNSTGPTFAMLQNDAAGLWSIAVNPTAAFTSGTPVIQWNNTGNVTIPAPSLGTALSVSGTTSLATLLATAATATALTVGGTAVPGGVSLTISNTSTVTGAFSRLSVNASTTQVNLYAANPAQATALVTGGPTGAQGVLLTFATYPLVFGTNNTYAGQIDQNQQWTINGLNGAPLTVGGNAVTGTITSAITNISSTDGDVARLAISASTTNLSIFCTNLNQSGPIITGGPVGAQATFRTLGAQPIVFGTGNTYRGQITGAGTWQIINVGAVSNSSTGAAGIQATFEFAANGNTVGTNSLVVGQTAAGQSLLLARGAQSLTIGTSGVPGAITISSTSNVTINVPAAGDGLTIAGVNANANGITETTSGASAYNPLAFSNSAGAGFVGLTAVGLGQFGMSSNTPVSLYTNNIARLTIAANGQISMSVGLSSGWGTPTGGAVVANYPGASATLVQTSNAVAQIITILKAFGLFTA